MNTTSDMTIGNLIGGKLADWRLGVFLLLIIPVVTFFSGAYPGLMLSRLQPVLALKGRTSAKGGSGFNTRRTLIIAQFVISQILIIGVVIMAHQMRYTTQADLGFNKNAVIMLPIGPGPEKAKTLKEQFSRLAGVQQVSLCRSAPLSDNNWITNFRYDTRNEEENFAINVRSADAQYVPLFELELVAGRNIQPADSAREFIVNETLAKKLGIRPDSILGHMLTVQGGTIKAPIVGVVKDFHDRSFHENIQPIGIASISDDYDYFGVKINLANMTSVIPALEKTWSDMYPDQVVEYSFLDDQIRELYQPVMLLLRLLETFAAIAVFIGCLGLYGMVSFMAAQKTKEIGIRKVLGSSVTQIIWIFAKEFSRLILIAFAVAVPLAWFVMHRWLDNFAYQVKIGPGIFILAIVLTFAIAMLTVGYQSVKAALVNPVKSLRAD